MGIDDHQSGRTLCRAPEYKVWCAMKRRCRDPGHWNYKYYGGRGITICDEWINNPWSFIEWMRSQGWVRGLKVDRIDNDAGYSPANCRLVDHTTQMRNQRDAFTITIDGVTKHAKDWAEVSGTNYYTIKSRVRMYGWGPKEAVFGRISNA
jgi:hypothetical protein